MQQQLMEALDIAQCLDKENLSTLIGYLQGMLEDIISGEIYEAKQLKNKIEEVKEYIYASLREDEVHEEYPINRQDLENILDILD